MLNLKDLTKEDWDLIIEGVDNLKSKDLTGKVLNFMLEGLTYPGKDASEEDKKEWEERKRLRDIEDEFKEKEHEKYIEKIDLLKAKLILMRNEIFEGSNK